MNPTSPDSNIRWHTQQVTRTMRESRNGHFGAIVWFTGLPSSGKSTLANGLEQSLFAQGCGTYVLDGDNVRHGLCRDLGFSAPDRAENIRRIGEMANLFLGAGLIVLAAFISPAQAERDKVRNLVGADRFLEIYCSCPVEICESRDQKGNYAKARAGLILNFTGISAPYQEPEHPDLIIDTDRTDLVASIAELFALLQQRGIFARDGKSNVG
jgi:adenylylsulfate kinase